MIGQKGKDGSTADTAEEKEPEAQAEDGGGHGCLLSDREREKRGTDSHPINGNNPLLISVFAP